MKLIILFCVITQLLGCVTNVKDIKDSAFVEKVINDFSRHSYYVLVNIKSSTLESKYLVTNSDLFYYYTKKNNFSQKQYQDFIRPLLINDDILNISSDDLKKFGFTLVSRAKLVETVKVGKSDLLQKYFNENHSLRKRVSTEQEVILIAALFAYQVAVRIDDESGFIFYSDEY